MTDAQSIKVRIRKKDGRKNFVMYYVDPVTGKQKGHRSTGKQTRREAERIAAKWEKDLRTGNHATPQRMGWEDFRLYYRTNHLNYLRQKSIETQEAGLNMVERILDPQSLAVIDKKAVLRLKKELVDMGRSPNTVNRILRSLKCAMRWAKNHDILQTVPLIEMIKITGRKAKGRGLTDVEFESLLDAALEVRPDDAERWQRLLRGCRYTGLRLNDLLKLRWDDRTGFHLDLSDLYPVIRIAGESQKNGKNEVLPVSPQAEAVFLATPQDQRQGFVFDLSAEVTPEGKNRDDKNTSRKISAMGEAAGIVVCEKKGKFASCHDIRDTFGTWMASKGISPYELQRMMRHADLKTTMEFYVDVQAQDMNANIRKLLGAEICDPFRDPSPLLGSAQTNTEKQNVSVSR